MNVKRELFRRRAKSLSWLQGQTQTLKTTNKAAPRFRSSQHHSSRTTTTTTTTAFIESPASTYLQRNSLLRVLTRPLLGALRPSPTRLPQLTNLTTISSILSSTFKMSDDSASDFSDAESMFEELVVSSTFSKFIAH